MPWPSLMVPLVLAENWVWVVAPNVKGNPMLHTFDIPVVVLLPSMMVESIPVMSIHKVVSTPVVNPHVSTIF